MLSNIGIRRAAITLLALAALHCSVAAEELTLKQAIELAVKCNPTVAAGQFSANAAAEAARGAKALTNPELIVAPSIVGEAGSDSALLLSQPLEINGSRKARARIAGQEAVAANQDARAISRDTVLKVKQLYWSTGRAQQLVDLNQDNVAYLETLAKAVRKQVDVGKIPGSQAIKTDVELARAQQELVQAQLELDSTKAALTTVVNRQCGDSLSIADELAFTEIAIDRNKLIATAIACRPEALASAAQLGAANGQIIAARANRIPDIALQARKESFDSELNDGGIALAITLPILDWGSSRAAIRQAQMTAQSRQKQLEAARNNVTLDVDQAILTVQTAAAVVRQYQGGILDKSTELAAMAQKGYERGATSYLEVLEAQRTLRGVKTEYYSALADHVKAVAQLEWASGMDLSCEELKK